MSELIVADDISRAWLQTLSRASASGGRQVHLVTAVTNPTAENQDVRAVLDTFLDSRGQQSVETVAETIFPSSLYEDPGFDWTPGLPAKAVRELDDAALDLYSSYLDMLPLLTSVRANNRGTYFSRMITWPGKVVGGTNQLALRIQRLRSEATNGRRTNNTLDVDVAADALEEQAAPVAGVQVFEVGDRRMRGFPCLTHLDLTLHDGTLHCTAVYRHQYLIEKAYGNLVGLGALLTFLCQQGGCSMGELVVHATLADAELSHRQVSRLVTDATAALDDEAT